ncbi:unnamed protein product [Lota lota]
MKSALRCAPDNTPAGPQRAGRRGGSEASERAGTPEEIGAANNPGREGVFTHCCTQKRTTGVGGRAPSFPSCWSTTANPASSRID